MRIFRCFDIQHKDGGNSFATHFIRAETLFRKLAATGGGILFELVDSLSGQASANLKKDGSLLKDYETTVNEYLECYDHNCPTEYCFDADCVKEFNAFSNMEHPFIYCRAADDLHDALKEIAEGFPERFPFRSVMIFFTGIDWFETGGYVNLPWLSQRWTLPNETELSWLDKFLVSSVVLWAQHIDDYDLQWGLRAVVEIEVPPADSTQVPDLPPKLYSYIDELGEITGQRLWVVPEETEERRLIEQETQAGQILADVYNQLQNHLNDIMLLNTVVPIDGMRNRPDLNSYIGPTGSMKSLLNLIFVPRGYRYQRTFSKGERFEGVIKRTKNNNYIVLDFSGIAFLNRFGFNFIVKGMFWEHTLPVTVPRDQVLRQHTRDFFDRQRYVHYAARIADNLETILVQRIESIYGPSPPWNSYDG